MGNCSMQAQCGKLQACVLFGVKPSLQIIYLLQKDKSSTGCSSWAKINSFELFSYEGGFPLIPLQIFSRATFFIRNYLPNHIQVSFPQLVSLVFYQKKETRKQHLISVNAYKQSHRGELELLHDVLVTTCSLAQED